MLVLSSSLIRPEATTMSTEVPINVTLTVVELAHCKDDFLQ